MRALLSTILSALVFIGLIALLITVIAAVSTALILGLAWGLSLVFPVGIMNVAFILMFTAGAFVFYIAIYFLTNAVRDRPPLSLPLFDEDWEDEDWEEEEEELPPPPPPPAWRKPPVKLPTVPPPAPRPRGKKR